MKDVEKLMSKLRRYIKQYNSSPYGREIDGTVELLEECFDKLAQLRDYEYLREEGQMITLPLSHHSVIYFVGETLCHKNNYKNYSQCCRDCHEDCDSVYTIHKEKVKDILAYISHYNFNVQGFDTFAFTTLDAAKKQLNYLKECGCNVDEVALNE